MKFLGIPNERYAGMDIIHRRAASINDNLGNPIKILIGLIFIGGHWKISITISSPSLSIYNNTIKYLNCGSDNKFVSMIYTSVINSIVDKVDFFSIYPPRKVLDIAIPDFDMISPIYKSKNFLEFLIKGLSTGSIINFKEEDLKIENN